MSSNPRMTMPDNRAMWAYQMKVLKQSLPSACTHLSTFKNIKGEYYVRVIVYDMEYLFNIPQNFVFKQADLDQLKKQILEKCNNNVSTGN